RCPLPAIQQVSALIEAALEPVDDGPIEVRRLPLRKYLIKPILPLDQEVQPALAIVDIEGEQEFHAGGETPLRFRRFEIGRWRSGAVDPVRVSSPGVDDLRDRMSER